MTLITSIKRNYKDAIISTCHERRCKLDLQKIKSFIILKGEKLIEESEAPICDCIIFIGEKNIEISLVELKSGSPGISGCVEKFKYGIDIAFDILNKCRETQIKYRIYFIILSGYITTSEYKKLKREKVKFKGKKYSIIRKKCGESLTNILSNYE